jgi:hypothetical protein
MESRAEERVKVKILLPTRTDQALQGPKHGTGSSWKPWGRQYSVTPISRGARVVLERMHLAQGPPGGRGEQNPTSSLLVDLNTVGSPLGSTSAGSTNQRLKIFPQKKHPY